MGQFITPTADGSSTVSSIAPYPVQSVTIEPGQDVFGHGRYTFVTGNNFTVPPGINAVRVSVFGAGGKGGTSAFGRTGYAGGGGAGGGFARGVVTGLTQGQVIPVTRGAVTSFGSYMSATAGDDAVGRLGGVNGGVGVGGDYNLTGFGGGDGSFARGFSGSTTRWRGGSGGGGGSIFEKGDGALASAAYDDSDTFSNLTTYSGGRGYRGGASNTDGNGLVSSTVPTVVRFYTDSWVQSGSYTTGTTGTSSTANNSSGVTVNATGGNSPTAGGGSGGNGSIYLASGVEGVGSSPRSGSLGGGGGGGTHGITADSAGAGGASGAILVEW